MGSVPGMPLRVFALPPSLNVVIGVCSLLAADFFVAPRHPLQLCLKSRTRRVGMIGTLLLRRSIIGNLFLITRRANQKQGESCLDAYLLRFFHVLFRSPLRRTLAQLQQHFDLIVSSSASVHFVTRRTVDIQLTRFRLIRC